MELKIIILLAVLAVVLCDQHEVEAENKTKKTVAAEKDQKSRSANPDKGSFQKLSNLMNNKTDSRRHKPLHRSKNFNKILQLNAKHKNQHDDMMNDNEGGFAINQRTQPDNDTNTLKDKMNILRKEGPDYNFVEIHNHVSQATGVFCNFENIGNDRGLDSCRWSWNSTVSSHGLGFNVVTADDLRRMNDSTSGLIFVGPETDADNNKSGET
ncbi:hypothetical protein O0L34_g18905 [Tuta absoluta]|nr:hypothetical protein O0L34_g18905 [Tuta absoluta]